MNTVAESEKKFNYFSSSGASSVNSVLPILTPSQLLPPVAWEQKYLMLVKMLPPPLYTISPLSSGWRCFGIQDSDSGHGPGQSRCCILAGGDGWNGQRLFRPGTRALHYVLDRRIRTVVGRVSLEILRRERISVVDMDQSKRFFCEKYLFQQIGKTIKGFSDGLDEVRAEQGFDDFFETYESSYSLTLAYTDEIILETAKQYNIETEGRDKKEIIKELFAKHGEI